MRHEFTLEYWPDGEWLFGRLVEIPSVFSQAETVEELRENIQEVYELLIGHDRSPSPIEATRQPMVLEL